MCFYNKNYLNTQFEFDVNEISILEKLALKNKELGLWLCLKKRGGGEGSRYFI